MSVATRQRAKHQSKAERAAAGKAARAEAPRSSHAGFQPPPDRHDPIALLEADEQSRVQDLLPIRHGRMLASAFTFFRGAAGLMAADLASAPRTGLHAQL